MPELATAVISKIRGHDEIGLGTILGSNIFNGFLIVGLAATICPITVDRTAVGVGLLVYEGFFLKKLKNVSYL
jgi:cation:H+ antiporter